MSKELYYRHSNRFTPFAPAAMILAGAAVGAVGGAVYGVAVLWCPFIYVNALLTFGLGAAVGYTVFKVARATHTRHPLLVLLAGAAAGLVAEYAAFVGWVYALSEWEVLVLSPATMAQVLPAIAEEGVWGLFGDEPVKGAFLYGVWLIEAAIIIGMAAGLGYRQIKRTPYCETAGAWLDERAILPPFEPVADPAAVRAQLESGDFSVIGQARHIDEGADKFSQMELVSSPDEEGLHLFTWRTVEIVTNRKGEAQAVSTPIVENMVIDAESLKLIHELGTAAPTPPADA